MSSLSSQGGASDSGLGFFGIVLCALCATCSGDRVGSYDAGAKHAAAPRRSERQSRSCRSRTSSARCPARARWSPISVASTSPTRSSPSSSPPRGPVAIILSVGARGGLSESDLSSWIFGAFFLNGFISLLFCWLYRQPLVFFWTIPGAVLVGPALGHLSFSEVIGAFWVTGLLMGVLGFTGWVRRAMQAVPMPIVMGMVAGVFLRFGLDLVYSMRDDFLLAAPMTLAFIVLTALPRLSRLLPPVVGALIVGAAVIAATDSFDAKGEQIFAMVEPNLYARRSPGRR